MISNQILQNTIDEIKSISGVDICIFDFQGQVIVTTISRGYEYEKDMKKFIDSMEDSVSTDSFNAYRIEDDGDVEYILLCMGENRELVGKMAKLQIESLMTAYRERYDKENFIKNLLMDNLLLVDIYNRAKKLHIETSAKRVVIIVETENEKDTGALETVKSLFSSKGKNFITALDEKNIIIVKELKTDEGYKDVEKTSKIVLDMLNTEAMSKVRVSTGTIVNELKEVSKSYKEAKMALEVGKIFYSERNIVAYNNLGIGRLIYQLPLPLCKMFIREIFDGKSPDDLDEETLYTINKFFENNLNVSETSRQLYIHRNTLVYRLDKLMKMTNLDLRKFEDAITFKIALMVVKYMKYMELQDF